MLNQAIHDPLAALELDSFSDTMEPSLDFLEAPQHRTRLNAEKLAALTWPTSTSYRLCFLCRKHPSVTFLNDGLCQLRKDLAKPSANGGSEHVNFMRCLNCPGPYRLDTAEGLAVLKRLERQGRRTGRTIRWRKSHA
ncbi:MAG: hypothetical protein V1806_07540 [Pseudomonadota bacterium]